MGEELLPGFFKTSPEQEQSLKQEKTESKFRRVAKFLVLIGTERAAEILSRLPPEQVEEVSKEIAAVEIVGAEERKAILEEFGSLLGSSNDKPLGTNKAALGKSKILAMPGVAADTAGASGGIAAARQFLHAAFGPEKGEQLLVRAVPDAKPNPFDFLESFSGSQLALLFQEESSQAAAMVFSRLPPKLSADTLSHITSAKKLEILRGIAHQRPVPPEVLEQVSAALKEKARKFGKTDDDETAFNGMETLAAILKSSASLGSEILNQLEEDDPELGKILKEKIYTLADLLDAQDLPIQKKLASMENRDIILLLKARAGFSDTVQFREKILRNLSHGRKEVILDEEGIMGAVPRKEVEEVATVFLSWFRQEREDGGIIMLNDDDLVI